MPYRAFQLLASWFLLLAFSGTATPQSFRSAWTDRSVAVDGSAGPTEWFAASSAIQFALGTVYVQNDASNVYFLVDLRGDTTADPRGNDASGDSIGLAFDINHDNRITPNVDRAYGLYPGTLRMGYQTYHGPGTFTGLQASASGAASRFNSSAGATPHRVWELRIPLSELGQPPGGSIRFGIQVHSVIPSFNESFPSDVNKDFSKFWLVRLSPPAPAATPARDQSGRPRLLPDGNVETRNPDGSVQRVSPGGSVRITYPDGSGRASAPITIIRGTPPPIPSNADNVLWLQEFNRGLGEILLTLAEGDAALWSRYERSEAGLDEYQRMQQRLRIIANLVPRPQP